MINSRISFVVNFIMTVVEWVLKIIFKWSETNHETVSHIYFYIVIYIKKQKFMGILTSTDLHVTLFVS